jgi:hypothetical protein
MTLRPHPLAKQGRIDPNVCAHIPDYITFMNGQLKGSIETLFIMFFLSQKHAEPIDIVVQSKPAS